MHRTSSPWILSKEKKKGFIHLHLIVRKKVNRDREEFLDFFFFSKTNTLTISSHYNLPSALPVLPSVSACRGDNLACVFRGERAACFKILELCGASLQDKKEMKALFKVCTAMHHGVASETHCIAATQGWEGCQAEGTVSKGHLTTLYWSSRSWLMLSLSLPS